MTLAISQPGHPREAQQQVPPYRNTCARDLGPQRALGEGDIPVHFQHYIRTVTNQREGYTEDRDTEMDIVRCNQPLKMNGETFSTFNKNIFSFEALEV